MPQRAAIPGRRSLSFEGVCAKGSKGLRCWVLGRWWCWRLLRKLDPGTRLVDWSVLKLEPVHRTLTTASVHDVVGGLWNAKWLEVRSAEQGSLSDLSDCSKRWRSDGEMQLPCEKKRGTVGLLKGKARCGRKRDRSATVDGCVVQGVPEREGGEGWSMDVVDGNLQSICSHVNNKQEKQMVER